MKSVTVSLVLCCLVGGALAQEPRIVQVVELPAPGGSINVELDIRVAGHSPQLAWDKFLNRFFDFFDRDGDGALVEAECARLPRLPVPEKKELALTYSALDLDTNGIVSRSELIE